MNHSSNGYSNPGLNQQVSQIDTLFGKPVTDEVKQKLASGELTAAQLLNVLAGNASVQEPFFAAKGLGSVKASSTSAQTSLDLTIDDLKHAPNGALLTELVQNRQMTLEEACVEAVKAINRPQASVHDIAKTMANYVNEERANRGKAENQELEENAMSVARSMADIINQNRTKMIKGGI